jgi:hypothetical protein
MMRSTVGLNMFQMKNIIGIKTYNYDRRIKTQLHTTTTYFVFP